MPAEVSQKELDEICAVIAKKLHAEAKASASKSDLFRQIMRLYDLETPPNQYPVLGSSARAMIELLSLEHSVDQIEAFLKNYHGCGCHDATAPKEAPYWRSLSQHPQSFEYFKHYFKEHRKTMNELLVHMIIMKIEDGARHPFDKHEAYKLAKDVHIWDSVPEQAHECLTLWLQEVSEECGRLLQKGIQEAYKSLGISIAPDIMFTPPSRVNSADFKK